MHKCLKCGNEFEGRFCPECGAKFVEPDSCPKCGAKHPPEAKFCPECGARLDGKIVCYKCGALSDAGTAFCVECGTRLGGAHKPQRAGGATVRDKVKFAINLSGIICIMLSALMGLVFTFVCGVSAKSGDTVVETSMLYDYFGNHYKDLDTIRNTIITGFNWKSMGGAREFALYFPVVLGTVISAVGILGVVALSALTGFNAYRKFYKKQEANIVAPAVATYLTFATLATLLVFLSATDSSGIKSVFSAPTLGGLITGGVLLGLGVLLIAGSHLDAFRGFDATVGTIVSVAVSALTVVVVALMALPSAGIKVFNSYYEAEESFGLFTGLQAMLLLVEKDETMFSLLAYATVGGAAGVALAIISAVTLFRKIPSAGNGKNKSNIVLCAVALALAAAYLAFNVLFMQMMPEVYEGLGVTEAKYEYYYAVPIAVLVMAALALAVEVAGRFIHRTPAFEEAAEVPAQTE